jgi:hypothetical protein
MMFPEKAEILRDIELAVAFDYNTPSTIEGMLDAAANAVVGETEQSGLPTEMQSFFAQQAQQEPASYIKWSEPKNEVQQYADMQQTPDTQPLAPAPQLQMDETSPAAILEMEMLLANNGSLMNGSVGGLQPAQDSNTQANIRAQRDRQRLAERKKTGISEITGINTGIGLGAEEERYQGDDADADIEEEMFRMFLNAATPNSGGSVPDEAERFGVYGEPNSAALPASRAIIS